MNNRRPIDRNTPNAAHTNRGDAHSDTLIDQIFRKIQRQIQNGNLQPRSRLPSVRQLAVEHRVSNETAHRAYDKLVAHGYIEARRGSGFYVTVTTPTPADTTSQRWAQQNTDHEWRSLLACDLPYERRPGCGTLPDTWIDRALLSTALRGLARMPSRAIADYETTKGYLPFRQQLHFKLAEQGIHAHPDQIVTTCGATEALHLILWSHIGHPGNYVIVEDPGPYMHIQRAMAMGLEIARLPREIDGPNIEVLRQICVERKPRALLCSSILQNPTSFSLSPHKAFQVLKLADEFDFIIIDDDSYGDLLPAADSNPVTRLATLDQLKRVFHIGSFSKTLGSGLRVGFVAGNFESIEQVALYKSASVISSSTLGERVVYQILSQGKYRHYCESLRSRLLECREPTMTHLTELGVMFPNKTSAGIYLWGSLGDRVNAQDVARTLMKRDYLMAPGSFFSYEAALQSFMRFNVPASYESPAIRELRTVLRDFAKGK